MTPKQKRIFDFIRGFINEHRFSPTLEEIALFAGVCKVTARQYIQALENQDLISRTRYGHRSIRLLENEHNRFSKLPLLGYIAAGSPIDAVEIPDMIDIEEMMNLGSGIGLFVLRVRGDSMVEEGILDGDYVIIQKRDTAENGDTVVALLDDGTATLKKLYREKNGFRLQPANEAMQPIYVKSLKVQGVVKGVFRPSW